MPIVNNIFNSIRNLDVLGPVKQVVKTGSNLVQKLLDKVTFGRGIKVWAQPKIKTIDSKNNFYEMQLDNGLKIIFKKSKGTEIKSSLTFNSGSAKDPKGKEGLAHFLEHIVCSNTAEFQDKIDDVVKINGGFYNAATTQKTTSYFVNLPKDKLDLILRIYRSFMSPLKFDDKVVEKEKGIISSELKMIQADPGQKQGDAVRKLIFGDNHPLSKSPIGNSDAILSTTKKDLEEFYNSEYVSNNATLVISGDFDEIELKNLTSKYFGDLKANTDLREVDTKVKINPSKTKPLKINDETLTSAHSYTYKLPSFNHKECLLGLVIADALSAGNNSRLIKKLVDVDIGMSASATGINCTYFASEDYGFFEISAKPLDQNRDANLKRIIEVIQEEIEDIKKNGLSETELKRTLKSLEFKEILKKDSQHADLGLVASYAQNQVDWKASLETLEDLIKITNEDIKAFANKYLNEDNRFAMTITGSGKGLNSDFKKDLERETVGDISFDKKEHQMTPEKFQEIKSLARGISNIDLKLTDLQKFDLASGIKVFLKEDHDLPLLFLDTQFPGGNLSVSKQEEPILNLLIGVLSAAGTYNPKTQRRLNSKDLEDIGLELGLTIAYKNSYDTTGFSFVSKSTNLDKNLLVLKELLNNPAIMETQNKEIIQEVENEFNKLKKVVLDMMNMMKKFPRLQLNQSFNNSLYPPGHENHLANIDEQIKNLEKITLDDLRNMYKRVFCAQKAKIAVVGDINQAQIQEKINPILQAWNQTSERQALEPDYDRIGKVESKPSKIQVVSSDNNEPEANVIIGNTAEIMKHDKHYFAAQIANSILGDGMSSRLFDHVREKYGLVYSIGSSLSTPKKGYGPFSINFGCDPRKTRQAIAATLAVIKKFLKEGITAEELEIQKSDIKKSFAMHTLNSRRQSQATLAGLLDNDKDENYINTFNQQIDAITIDDVIKAAKKFIKPENFSIVVSKPKDFELKAQENPKQKRDMNMAIAA